MKMCISVLFCLNVYLVTGSNTQDCISNAGFRLHNIFVGYDVILTLRILTLHVQKKKSGYTLLPDHSLLAIYNNVCAIFKKIA